MDRVMLVSYRFPPAGGPGVQRNLKYTKYLPGLGFSPVVLTTKSISYYVYDPHLLNEIPKDADVLRAGSLDPARLSYLALRTIGKDPVRDAYLGLRPKSESARKDSSNAGKRKSSSKMALVSDNSFLVRLYRSVRDWAMFPDGSAGWIPFALAKGWFYLRAYSVKAIVGAYGPPSNLVVAFLLSKLTGVPLVLDFRDGWIDYPYRNDPTSIHLYAHKWLERIIVTGADHIIAYGPYLSERLVDRYPEIVSRISHIPNGFDPEDFEGLSPIVSERGRFRFVHTGNLLSYRSGVFESMLDAIVTLGKDVLNKVEFVFVGNAYDGAQESIDDRGLSGVVLLEGYKSHRDSLRYLLGASAGMIILPAGDKAAVTGKVFEYLGAQIPILALAEPEGALARLIKPLGQDVVHPEDVDGMVKSINEMVQTASEPVSYDSISFSREVNTKKLARIIRTL